MKKINTILLAAAMACGTLTASAVPAMRGVWRTLTLADGTQVRAQLQGDEFCSYYQAADGTCYNLASNMKFYTKANLNDILANGESKREAANVRRSARLRAQTRGDIGKPEQPIIGKKKGLIILVEYQDTKFGIGYNQKYVDGYVNGPLLSGHTKRGFVGTVKDYFLAQSNGQFELDFDVVGPYTLSQNYAYYGAHGSSGENDVRRGTMILEAVKAADPDVNYADYSWNNNGEVDQVYVLYAGHGEADGSDVNTIWPHESALTDSEVGVVYTTGDVDASGNKVIVDTYACGPELLQSTRAGIGTLCHEFSHCLGYPDLYDTAYGGHMGMACWDLMDQGSYNGSSFCPPNFTAYEKWYAGWIEPIVLDKATTVKGVPAQDVKYGQTFVVYNDATQDEYYLLENRQNTVGLWDTKLPASGMMITHVDYDKDIWYYNRVNTNANYTDLYNDHERCTIFCADNDRRYGSGGATPYGDLYPYDGNNELTDTSKPAARIYNGGKRMGKPITNITQNEDGTIDFDFMGGSSENVITGIGGITTTTVKKVNDNRVYSLDGRYLGNDIEAVGSGVFVQNGKKIVK